MARTPEEIAVYHRHWCEANPERVKAYSRKWRDAHPEEKREASRRDRKAHAGRCKVTGLKLIVNGGRSGSFNGITDSPPKKLRRF